MDALSASDASTSDANQKQMLILHINPKILHRNECLMNQTDSESHATVIYEWKVLKNVEIGFLSSEIWINVVELRTGSLSLAVFFRFVHLRFVEADRRILSDLLASEKKKHSPWCEQSTESRRTNTKKPIINDNMPLFIRNAKKNVINEWCFQI